MAHSKSLKAVRWLFVVVGLYDGLLGGVFLLAPAWAMKTAGIADPPHAGYVQFSAALLVVFAAMFFGIAGRPRRNRNLIPYGIGLKIAYCGVVGWYWWAGQASMIWKPFLVCDVIFLVAFVWAYAALRRSRSRPGYSPAARRHSVAG